MTIDYYPTLEMPPHRTLHMEPFMNAEELRIERVRRGVFSPLQIRITHIASGLSVTGFAPDGDEARLRFERMLLLELERMVSAKSDLGGNRNSNQM